MKRIRLEDVEYYLNHQVSFIRGNTAFFPCKLNGESSRRKDKTYCYLDKDGYPTTIGENGGETIFIKDLINSPYEDVSIDVKRKIKKKEINYLEKLLARKDFNKNEIEGTLENLFFLDRGIHLVKIKGTLNISSYTGGIAYPLYSDKAGGEVVGYSVREDDEKEAKRFSKRMIYLKNGASGTMYHGIFTKYGFDYTKDITYHFEGFEDALAFLQESKSTCRAFIWCGKDRLFKAMEIFRENSLHKFVLDRDAIPQAPYLNDYCLAVKEGKDVNEMLIKHGHIKIVLASNIVNN